MSPGRGLDTKTDRLTDRQSQCDSDSDSDKQSSRVGSEGSNFERTAGQNMSFEAEELNGVESSEVAVAE
jgi:hypothetical protein